MSECEVWKAAIAQQPEWWTTDCWATPWHIVRGLESEFGAFDLDPCCQAVTAKAPRFFTPADDGLQSAWFGRVFLNPPYSDPAPWLHKAIAETSIAGRAALVVALLPASTDTRWFHELVLPRAEVRFLRGRIRFLGWSEQPLMRPKWGSIIAVYRRTAVREELPEGVVSVVNPNTTGPAGELRAAPSGGASGGHGTEETGSDRPATPLFKFA